MHKRKMDSDANVAVPQPVMREAQRTEPKGGGLHAQMTPNQIAEAYRASIKEHRIDLVAALGSYRKALFWSAVMGMVS